MCVSKSKKLLLYSTLLILKFSYTSQEVAETQQIKKPSGFCYLDTSCGPSSNIWTELCHSGKRQSPIDLPYNSTIVADAQANPQPIYFDSTGYKFSSFYIQNMNPGIQISFTPEMNSTARMSGYGFQDPYILAQVHFHWAEDITLGSEHTVNGFHYPVEFHLVHYSSKYGSYAEAAAAVNDSTSLAVIGIFLVPDGSSHEIETRVITDSIPLKDEEQQTKNQKVNEPLDLTSFLPQSGQTFYRYFGSLTTPKCTENVIWTVFAEPLKIPQRMYKKFQSIQYADSTLVVRNFRTVQPLGGRVIEVCSRSYF
jgi:carbonic anhydrase